MVRYVVFVLPMVVIEGDGCASKSPLQSGKIPQHGVSVQQLQTDYKAHNFLAALQLFLNSHATQDEVVCPKESDQFDVFNQLYITSGPSVVTGHGHSWKKICAKPKVAASGHKAGSPARFDTMFVWDEGHELRDSFGPDSKYLASSMQ